MHGWPAIPLARLLASLFAEPLVAHLSMNTLFSLPVVLARLEWPQVWVVAEKASWLPPCQTGIASFADMALIARTAEENRAIVLWW